MRKAEIVIIGGGVVGASVAFHLAERRVKDVVILEAEEVQGRGSTGAATGGIRAQFETDINILMSLYSMEFLKNCEFDCGYDPKGYLFFATTDEQFEYLKQNVSKQRSLGVNDVEAIDANAIAEIVPGMNCDDVVGGSFGKHDGFINPLALMHGFTKAAQNRGVEIEFGRRVTEIKVESDRVGAVQVGDETIECESVVLCNGAI